MNATKMKITIITDPPTILRKSAGDVLGFGGSYQSISNARLILENHHHHVDTLIVFQDGFLMREEEFLQSCLEKGEINDVVTGKGISIEKALKNAQLDVLLITLRTRILRRILRDLFETLIKNGKSPVLLIAAGKSTSNHVLSVANSFDLKISIIHRPGVARITRKGLEDLISKIG